MRLFVALAIGLAAAPASADLYRWVDPDTGSTKYSSYPPPWFGDPARERRAPKVEVIPTLAPAAAKPAPDRAELSSEAKGSPAPARPPAAPASVAGPAR